MKKIKVKLVGEDGNVFNLIGKVVRALKKEGLVNEVKEFSEKAFSSKSYDEVLQLIMTYVDVT